MSRQLTISSAVFADEYNESVVLQTAEAGAVACSLKDRPELWARLQEWLAEDPRRMVGSYLEIAKKVHMEMLVSRKQEAIQSTADKILMAFARGRNADESKFRQKLAVIEALDLSSIDLSSATTLDELRAIVPPELQ